MSLIRLLVPLLVLIGCSSSTGPTRVEHFVKQDASGKEAQTDYKECKANAPFIIRPTEGPLIPCMVEKGYQFKPVWHRVPGFSGGDSEIDDLECRKGRAVGSQFVSTRGYILCMDERGWNYRPSR